MLNKIIPYNPKLKALAKQLRKEMTFSEVLLWRELNGDQMLGYDFDRQKPIDEYIVDFYCQQLQLVIEIDGKYHSEEKTAEKDDIRQKKLESFGVKFLRYSELEVQKNILFVLNDIHDWIIENQLSSNK
jgi:very-short-patch-repair endonuclease